MRNRPIGILALVAGILTATLTQAAPPPGVPAIPWDIDDPVNIAETREYFTLIYDSLNGGEPFHPDDFVFTNPRPEMDTVLMLPAINLFSAVYQHRLGTEDTFDIFDLVDQDPTVHDQFWTYLTEGLLTTDLAIDDTALLVHLELLIDASDCHELVDVRSFGFTSTGLESFDLAIDKKCNPGPVLEPDPDNPTDFECDLGLYSQRSLLACMEDKDLYLPDGSGIGRFDCEDFASAMALWLLEHLSHHYPGMQVQILAFYWTCPGGTTIGHAMPVVIIDGKYYLVEPYDGSFTGPFDSMQEAMEQGLSVYASCPDGSTPSTSGPVVYPPDDYPDNWTDPWWEYEDMQQRFCEALADCCDEIEDDTTLPPPVPVRVYDLSLCPRRDLDQPERLQ